MPGIMQTSTAAAVGDGVSDLAVYPDPLPAFGWTHRWVGYAAPAEPGGTVSILKDLIGTSHLVLDGITGQSGSVAPVAALDADGRYVVRFNGTTNRLSTTYATPVAGPFTYVAAFRCITPVASGTGMVMGAANSATGALFCDSAAVRLNGGSTITSTPNLVAGKVYIIIGVVNGASSVLRVMGRAEITGTTGVTTATTLNVGSGGSGAPSGSFNMDLIELLVTPQALDLSQRDAIEAALKASHSIV